MAHGARAGLLGLLILAGSASAVTVGPIKGRPVTGKPLEVNIPFSLDAPAERACASAKVRYGSAPAPRMVLDVQGSGLKRNLQVTSGAKVKEQAVTVDVRVGCGAKAVSRSFLLVASDAAGTGKARTVAEPVVRQASTTPPRAAQKPAPLLATSEPLFPPPVSDAPAAPDLVPRPDAATLEELRQARTEAATATARLESVRKELAAVLDVQRRTAQILINADHQVRDAKSDVARMWLVLKSVAAGLVLVAAGLAWFEFQRVMLRRRAAQPPGPQEPTMLSGEEVPA